MNLEKRKHKIPDIVLERYLLGVLSESERTEIKKALEEDKEVRERFAALEKSNQDILEQYPPELVAQRIRFALVREYGSVAPKRTFPLFVKYSMGAAAAFMLLFLILPSGILPWDTHGPESLERVKGQGPSLKLYRKTPSGSEVLEDGDTAFKGDVLRIGYQAAGRAFGVIISVDGRGLVTLHWPESGDRSAPLRQDGQVFLNFAIELDDAPRWERFFFVTDYAPFDVNQVLRAAERIKIKTPADHNEKLNLPQELDQFLVSIQKGVRK